MLVANRPECKFRMRKVATEAKKKRFLSASENDFIKAECRSEI